MGLKREKEIQRGEKARRKERGKRGEKEKKQRQRNADIETRTGNKEKGKLRKI